MWWLPVSVIWYYRYYNLYIAQKVNETRPDARDAAVINNDGLNCVPTNRYTMLFGHLCHRRRRSAGRAGIGRTRWAVCRDTVAAGGRGARGRSAGLYGAVHLFPP